MPRGVPPEPRRVLDPLLRFWVKVLPVDSGCWLWTGARRHGGYGVMAGGRGGTPLLCAHRFAYEQAYGPLPTGAYACHTCDTPGCVNPAHLFAASAAENTRDMCAKGRAWWMRHGRARRGRNGSVACDVDLARLTA